jgi:hypothetical protein
MLRYYPAVSPQGGALVVSCADVPGRTGEGNLRKPRWHSGFDADYERENPSPVAATLKHNNGRRNARREAER